MKKSHLPDHADRRKTSNDAKQALIERIKAGQKGAKPAPADDGKTSK